MDEISEQEFKEGKQRIDSMSHIELCHMWRFSSSGNRLLQGRLGEYYKDRLYKHFGGFTPEISKLIGW